MVLMGGQKASIRGFICQNQSKMAPLVGGLKSEVVATDQQQ